MKKISVIFLVLIILFSITACSKTIKTEDGEISFNDGEIQIETEEGTATIEEDKMTFEDEEGNVVFESSEDGLDLPDGYPLDLVPIISDSSIIVASMEEVAEGNEYWITLMTKKEIKDAIDFYKKVLNDAEEASSLEAPDMSIFSGVKEETHITVTIMPGDNDYKTHISIAAVKAE